MLQEARLSECVEDPAALVPPLVFGGHVEELVSARIRPCQLVDVNRISPPSLLLSHLKRWLSRPALASATITYEVFTSL